MYVQVFIFFFSYICSTSITNSLFSSGQNKEEGSQVSTSEPGGEYDEDTGIVFPRYTSLPRFSPHVSQCYLFLSSGQSVPACVALIAFRDASMQFTCNISKILGGATI